MTTIQKIENNRKNARQEQKFYNDKKKHVNNIKIEKCQTRTDNVKHTQKSTIKCLRT